MGLLTSIKKAVSSFSSGVQKASSSSSSFNSSSSSSNYGTLRNSISNKKNTFVNTGGVGNSGSSVKAPTQSPTSSASTQKPSYGYDAQGYYKQVGTNKTYVNNSNKQYFPSNYGGTANWQYSSPTNQQTQTNKNGYNTSFLNSDYGKIANDHSYEGVKKAQETLAQMKGADESLYSQDEYAHRMWEVANGKVNFGNGQSPYYSVQYADTNKRYDNDMSEAYLSAFNFYNKVGSQNINQYLQMNSQQLAKAMNDIGIKAVTPQQLYEVANPNYKTNGYNVYHSSIPYSDYIDWATTTNVNGKGALSQTLLNNTYIDENGNSHLNSGLVDVNGMPMHWSNYVKYGAEQQGEVDLYKNMLQNEKVYGFTENIPLKARAELAPETMTPEMKQDLQTQLDLENQITQIDALLTQLDAQVPQQEKQIVEQIPSATTSSELDFQNNNGTSGNVYSGVASVPNLSTGVANLPFNLSDLSEYLVTLGRAKGSKYGEGLGNLTQAQIAQLNAMRNRIMKNQGVM